MLLHICFSTDEQLQLNQGCYFPYAGHAFLRRSLFRTFNVFTLMKEISGLI